MRTCARLRCERPAEATVAVRYADQVVIVRELLPERDPNLLDLCAGHADALTAPRGWRLEDGRSAGERLPA